MVADIGRVADVPRYVCLFSERLGRPLEPLLESMLDAAWGRRRNGSVARTK
jgi:hypothetical protein